MLGYLALGSGAVFGHIPLIIFVVFIIIFISSAALRFGCNRRIKRLGIVFLSRTASLRTAARTLGTVTVPIALKTSLTVSVSVSLEASLAISVTASLETSLAVPIPASLETSLAVPISIALEASLGTVSLSIALKTSLGTVPVTILITSLLRTDVVPSCLRILSALRTNLLASGGLRTASCLRLGRRMTGTHGLDRNILRTDGRHGLALSASGCPCPALRTIVPSRPLGTASELILRTAAARLPLGAASLSRPLPHGLSILRTVHCRDLLFRRLSRRSGRSLRSPGLGHRLGRFCSGRSRCHGFLYHGNMLLADIGCV